MAPALTYHSHGGPRCIVWQTAAGAYTNFEFQYIDKVLLAGVADARILDFKRYRHKAAGCTVVVSHDKSIMPSDLLSYLQETRPRVLIHLSGEHLRSTDSLYQTVPVVLRTHYDPRVTKRDVFTFPLGFKSGHFREPSPAIAEPREFVWSFAGQIRGDRAEMLECLKSIGPHHVHPISGWSTADSLTPEELSDLLRRSTFGPCPFGIINPDSFRVMECLEAGVIPVGILFRRVDYFRYVYGNHPFIVAKNWPGVAREISKLVENPQALQAKQQAVLAWYQNFKHRLAADVAAILDMNFQAIQSEQFKYQRAGRHSVRLKLLFNLHFGTTPKYRALRMRLVRWGLWN